MKQEFFRHLYFSRDGNKKEGHINAAQATLKGSRSLLCGGNAENVDQPGFYVEPHWLIT